MKAALKEELFIVQQMRMVMFQYLTKQGPATEWAKILHDCFVNFAQHTDVGLLGTNNVWNKGGKTALTLSVSKRKNPHLMTLTDLRSVRLD